MNLHPDRPAEVRSRIARACRKAGREASEITLLAVSKGHPAGRVRALYQAGLRRFGENRVQEAMAKQDQLSDLAIEWHLIGPLQSNKTREAATRFSWVQSVDRERILRRLSDQRPPELPPLNICLQVNIDREPQKHGLDPEAVPGLAAQARGLPGLRLRGLMCIPRLTQDAGATRQSFDRTRALFQQLQDEGLELDTLSMGMSADLEIAVAAGSTLLRVGTDLFGPRPTPARAARAGNPGARPS